MTKLRVDSVLCHAALDVELSPGVTLITGRNTSGKTSLARILAALTAHDANPAHVAATNAKAYVQDGALEGQARLGEVIWRPPAGISAPPHQAPTAVPHAVGLVEFVRGNRAAKERAKLWEGLFLPEDVVSILRPRWTLPEAQLAVVLETIDQRGWEAAATIYEQKRVEAKRRWESITGQGRYGDAKASAWVPPNWRAELEGAARHDLEAACVDLRDQLQSLSARQTIEQSRIDEAKEVLTGKIPLVERELEENNNHAAELAQRNKEVGLQHQTAMKALKAAENETHALSEILEATPPHKCPHCEKGLRLGNGQILRWDAPTPEQLIEANDKRNEVAEKGSIAANEVETLGQILSEIRGQITNTRMRGATLKGELAVLREQAQLATVEPSQGDDIQRARVEQELEEANRALAAHQQWEAAKREHDNVIELDNVCKLLGPTGARAEHMRAAMDKVRQVMTNACMVSGWDPITILDDYSLTSAHRPIALCAHNEQMKAQWLCQIAAAMLTGSEWLVLDQADLLRDESWDGLEALLSRVASARPGPPEDEQRPALHVVVCATSTSCPEGWEHVRLGA